MVKRRVSLFGATGSVGRSAVDVLKRHADKFEVVAVAANERVHELAALASELNAKEAVICNEKHLGDLRNGVGANIRCAGGESALLEAAAADVDLVIMAISGAAGLRATFAASENGTDIALATKESVVSAGDLLMRLVAKSGTKLFPVDSEHNALFQIMSGRDQSQLQTITLTASGGPFREWTLERLAAARPQDALAHPVWTMGDKISVDCATMMNKGLELIEAQHLFNLKAEQLDVLVHPQSVIHALASYSDGSVLAQLAKPDMRVAISSCLAWPERLTSGVEQLDLAKLQTLTFEKPDMEKFPCLRLAREAMSSGCAFPCIMNAANEIAVSAFLHSELSFTAISEVVEKTLEKMKAQQSQKAFSKLEDVLETDREARKIAASFLPHSGASLKRASA